MRILLSILFIFADENISGIVNAPGETWFEPTIINLVSWLKLFVEMTGAAIIALGVILAAIEFIRVLFSKTGGNYNSVRLLLARYLALALEFQLGADILSTAIAPGWDQIGKLGAIAVIRTALNYFLSREMEEERKITKTENKIDDSLKI
ncbi:MAG: DUF1622 domain-containing protein [Pyrinomonadaceae bacterium]